MSDPKGGQEERRDTKSKGNAQYSFFLHQRALTKGKQKINKKPAQMSDPKKEDSRRQSKHHDECILVEESVECNVYVV